MIAFCCQIDKAGVWRDFDPDKIVRFEGRDIVFTDGSRVRIHNDPERSDQEIERMAYESLEQARKEHENDED